MNGAAISSEVLQAAGFRRSDNGCGASAWVPPEGWQGWAAWRSHGAARTVSKAPEYSPVRRRIARVTGVQS